MDKKYSKLQIKQYKRVCKIFKNRDQNIDGKEATPFLLKRINEITKGESSISNVALIVNNARVGAEIAL